MTAAIDTPMRICAHVPFTLVEAVREYCRLREISLDEGLTRVIVYGLAAINTELVEDKADEPADNIT